jgi:hypothetical protein
MVSLNRKLPQKGDSGKGAPGELTLDDLQSFKIHTRGRWRAFELHVFERVHHAVRDDNRQNQYLYLDMLRKLLVFKPLEYHAIVVS